MRPIDLSRSASAWILALAPVALAASCSSSDSPTGSATALAEACSINSDCTSPLVCAYRKCHAACETSRDCATGQRCMVSDRPFHVCQLPEEQKCSYNSDCPSGQVCGVDGSCRDQCSADRDCVLGQVCVTGSCAEPVELDAGHLVPSADASQEQPGQPCSYTSECQAPLVCRSGLCAFECLSNGDCPSGTTCAANACRPATCNAADAGIDASTGGACAFNSECPDPLICKGGVCTCECIADGDCSSFHRCIAARCELTCPAANQCGSSCFDTQTDVAHCGGCSIACQVSGANSVPGCSGGQCVLSCAAGFSNCDGDDTNGCELPTSADPMNCGACGNDCKGGGCNAGVCTPAPTVVATGLGQAGALTAFGGNLYVFDGSSGSVLMAPVGGGMPSPIAVGVGPVGQLVADATWLYILSDMYIYRSPSTGQASQPAPWAFPYFAANLVFDANNAYWADSNFQFPNVQQLAVAADGGAPIGLAPTALMPSVVAVYGAYVYYADNGNVSAQYASTGIWRVPVGGGASPVQLLTTANPPWRLFVDAGGIYFAVTESLERIPLAGLADGGASTVLATPNILSSVVEDATALYWIDSGAGTVSSTPKAGGATKVLAVGHPAQGLTVDAGNVYFTTETGEILGVPK